MEQLFASIDYRDPVWILVAFAFGYVAARLALPPLVGFLAAGFTLHAFGAEGGTFLGEMADLGVTLLLFSIGLKLRPAELLRKEIWGVASIHLAMMTLITAAVFVALSYARLPLIADLTPATALLLGFALAFSSTVFAVKVLEEKNDSAANYGRIAVGLLIMQDIAAVIFLGVSAAKVPSPWAAGVLVLLLLGRPVLRALLHGAGHGELQVLYGLVLALGGAGLFELVDMKGDLGALVFGMLLAGHPKATELFKALLSLKDLFLVGFFLSIGMAGLPEPAMLLIAVLLVLTLPFKTALYFWLLASFRVRVRAASLTAQSLSNFSEFGLIVTAIAVGNGWLSTEWLATVAVAVALSFILASAVSANADRGYVALRPWLQRFEHRQRLQGDEAINFDGARILVFGMGRIGSGAYDRMREQYGDAVIGIDFDPAVVARQRKSGRRVKLGNLTNPDFWIRIDRASWRVESILLALPTVHASLKATSFAREWGFKGFVAATARYEDDATTLHRSGVDAVFNIYAEAGSGFAEHAQELFARRASQPEPASATATAK